MDFHEPLDSAPASSQRDRSRDPNDTSRASNPRGDAELKRDVSAPPDEDDLTAIVADAVADFHTRIPDRRITVQSGEPVYVGEWKARRVAQIVVRLLERISIDLPAAEAINVRIDAPRDRGYIDISHIHIAGIVTADARVRTSSLSSTSPASSASDTSEDDAAWWRSVRELVTIERGRLWTATEDDIDQITIELPQRWRDADFVHAAFGWQERRERSAESLKAQAPKRFRPPPPWTHHVDDERLRALLEMWRTLDPNESLPHPDALPLDDLEPWRHEMSFARIDVSGSESILAFIDVGGSIERRLSVPLNGTRYVLGESPNSLLIDEFVRRYDLTRTSGVPQYDYARYTLRGSKSGRFARLVLPFSRNPSQGVTHLIAMVRFSSLATGSERHFIKMVTDNDW